MNQNTDYGSLFLSTGGLLIASAAICLVAGTIGMSNFIAALIAAYVTLVIVNNLDRADKRSFR